MTQDDENRCSGRIEKLRFSRSYSGDLYVRRRSRPFECLRHHENMAHEIEAATQFGLSNHLPTLFYMFSSQSRSAQVIFRLYSSLKACFRGRVFKPQ